MLFRDIKGQDRAINLLKQHFLAQRVSKSYLFVGPEGVGKLLAARAFAQLINCQEAVTDACGECQTCKKIAKGQHPDLHILAGSIDFVPLEGEGVEVGETDAIKIEFIRQLHKDIALRPYEGKNKVFIIDNAQRLTAQASNALLKVLEEPPKDSVIILVTASPQLLLKTIVSRCQVVRFAALNREVVGTAISEGAAIDDSAAHFLAYYCQGQIGRAVRLKKTGIFTKKNSIINQFVFSKQEQFDSTDIKKKEDARLCLNILASWFRDIYMLKIGVNHSRLIHLDRKKELLEVMAQYGFPELDKIFTVISDSLQHIEENVNTKLLLSHLRMAIWT